MHPELRHLVLRHGGRCSQPHCRRPIGRKSGGRDLLTWRPYVKKPIAAIVPAEDLQPVCTACAAGLKRFENCPGALACAVAMDDVTELRRRILPPRATVGRSNRHRALAGFQKPAAAQVRA